MIKSAQDVADDIEKWIDSVPHPDEWKMREWVAVLRALPTEARRSTCPENELPCDSGCTGGWCRTLFGHQPEPQKER